MKHALLFIYFLTLFIFIAFKTHRKHLKTNDFHNTSYEQEVLYIEAITNNSLKTKIHPHDYVYLKEAPSYLLDLLVFQEDQNFYFHRGYSLPDMFITLRDFLFRGHRLRGASTITQQLARTLFLGREVNLKRKILEIKYSRLLEKNMDKQKILEWYINHVFWGLGIHGIKAASKRYFHTEPKNISLEQSYFLVSLLPNPSSCSSYINCHNKGVQRRINRLKKYYELSQKYNSFEN